MGCICITKRQGIEDGYHEISSVTAVRPDEANLYLHGCIGYSGRRSALPILRRSAMCNCILQPTAKRCREKLLRTRARMPRSQIYDWQIPTLPTGHTLRYQVSFGPPQSTIPKERKRDWWTYRKMGVGPQRVRIRNSLHTRDEKCGRWCFVTFNWSRRAQDGDTNHAQEWESCKHACGDPTNPSYNTRHRRYHPRNYERSRYFTLFWR